jgi:hypothetical protein
MNAKTALVMVAALALFGCQERPKTEEPVKQPANAAQPQTDPHAGLKSTEVPAGIPTKKATVVQTIDADIYTYIEAKGDDGKTVWMAMPTIKVAKGAAIEYPTNVPPMTNFTSKTLNKTFESILFLQGITIVK